MNTSTDAPAFLVRMPAGAASPWGRRPFHVWALILEGWREAMEILVRTGGTRPPWGLFP
jgi:hypothetical protein